jgi:hypothetical protein
VQVEQLALGSKTGAIEDGIYRMWGDEPERQVYPFARLDDYVRNNNITRLDCIKIDVDSFDFEVLLGARETLRDLKPAVVVELNHALSRRNQSNLKALEWLCEQGIGEALSLDGDNFVIMPGGRVADSYPTARSMSILFADTREIPSAEDQGAIRVIKVFDPHNAGVVHGDTQTTVLPGGSQIEVITPEPQWSFALGFPMTGEDGLKQPGNLRVLMDLEVIEGRVGVGCLGGNEYLGPERQIGPGARRSVMLPVKDPGRLTEVMVRNVSEFGERSRLRILGLKLGELMEVEAEELELSAAELARRVQDAVSTEGTSAAAAAPRDGAIAVVAYENLQRTLGFDEAFVQPPGSGETALTFWRMERDDAPIFRYVYRGLKPRRHLEFGTWEGFGVVACAESCEAEIWTLNLPDGERTAQGRPVYAAAATGEAAVQTDAGDFIGHLYREAGYGSRVHQLLSDSIAWQPDMPEGFFDSVLIDGGHTAEVVVSDTDKAIALTHPGAIVMWHDFCPDEEALQAHVAPRGVVQAVADNLHRWSPHFSKLLWVKPSWVLIGVRR